ncbi:putative mitotic check point protein BUB2 [Balamuthia mandrillaris]
MKTIDLTQWKELQQAAGMNYVNQRASASSVVLSPKPHLTGSRRGGGGPSAKAEEDDDDDFVVGDSDEEEETPNTLQQKLRSQLSLNNNHNDDEDDFFADSPPSSPKKLPRSNSSSLNQTTSTKALITPKEKHSDEGSSFAGTLSPFESKLRVDYETLLQEGREGGDTEIDVNLYNLRKLVLVGGLPPETESERRRATETCSLRAKVWKVLLRIRGSLEARRYVEWVRKGAYGGELSEAYLQIRKDIGRTGFGKVTDFKQRVPEQKLSRVLNVFLRSCDEREARNQRIAYVQGLNTVAAMFLYVMPELDAFHCLRELVLSHCPLYYRSKKTDQQQVEEKLKAGEKGEEEEESEEKHWSVKPAVRLVQLCLEIVDSPLYDHLNKCGVSPYLYTPYILTFNACSRPLDQIIELWDMMLAFGMHLNILFTVARIVIHREELLKEENPNVPQIIDKSDLDAQLIISVAVQFVRQIPQNIYELLVQHPRQDIHLDDLAESSEESTEDEDEDEEEEF